MLQLPLKSGVDALRQFERLVVSVIVSLCWDKFVQVTVDATWRSLLDKAVTVTARRYVSEVSEVPENDQVELENTSPCVPVVSDDQLESRIARAASSPSRAMDNAWIDWRVRYDTTYSFPNATNKDEAKMASRANAITTSIKVPPERRRGRVNAISLHVDDATRADRCG